MTGEARVRFRGLRPRARRSIYNRMVVFPSPDDARADLLLHALADATRRDIVRRALAEAHSVSELARPYPMSFAAVQKHVAVLERAGLVTKRRRGREQLVRTEVERLRAATRVLDELEAVWRDRMHQVDRILAEPDGVPNPPQAEGAHPCP